MKIGKYKKVFNILLIVPFIPLVYLSAKAIITFFSEDRYHTECDWSLCFTYDDFLGDFLAAVYIGGPIAVIGSFLIVIIRNRYMKNFTSK